MVEPACAAPLAGLIKCIQAGEIAEGSLVTATMTGHGLKDPDRAIAVAGFEPITVPPTKEKRMNIKKEKKKWLLNIINTTNMNMVMATAMYT